MFSTSALNHSCRGSQVTHELTLAARGLFLSHGDFYAATVIEQLGLRPEGLVRAGCACYTTREEVERLVAGVGEIAGTV